MKWRIPAKTFLVGEYAAVAGSGAVILTTTPCFELALLEEDNIMQGIHPDSPAGLLWAQHRISSQGMVWHDPYQERGGLGASSAQFLATYLASCHLLSMIPTHEALLETYYQYAWRGKGLKPSGYDLLAQSQNRCVYINREQKLIKTYDWPFTDISFLLLHSGQKLATHQHLRLLNLAFEINELSNTVQSAQAAFECINSEELIKAIHIYQQQLANLNLVAPHTLEHIQKFKSQSDVLAAKGCGALGADVLLLIVPRNSLKTKAKNLGAEGWTVLATSEELYTGPVLMKNKPLKPLEILT